MMIIIASHSLVNFWDYAGGVWSNIGGGDGVDGGVHISCIGEKDQIHWVYTEQHNTLEKKNTHK